MFKRLVHLEEAFQYVRRFTVIVILGCIGITCYALYQAYAAVSAGQAKVYILSNAKAFEAIATGRETNLRVEATDHVRTFHEKFFTLAPDEQMIRRNITSALYLCDASAKRQYDNLKENGFYTDVMAGNISQTILIDSVQLTLEQEPYYFRCYATQQITRTTSIVTRTLITEGWLRSVARSEHNPHGFLIERWTTLLNKDVNIKNR